MFNIHRFCGSDKVQFWLLACSWLTYGIAMACLWPRSGKHDWATQAPSVIAACGPDLHAKSARCGPDLGRNNVAMWGVNADFRYVSLLKEDVRCSSKKCFV